MKIFINDVGNAVIEDNAVDLCVSCRYTYEDCPSRGGDVLYGKGRENICCCVCYIPVRTREEIDEP